MKQKQKFLQSIPSILCDPVTGLKASNETELSALLSYYHSRGSVDWSCVNLYKPKSDKGKYLASEYIDKSASLFCEYPLFSNAETVNIWGGMPADLLSFSENKIVLIENKIGSKFTSAGTQLMRQAEYVDSSHFDNKVLIVLTSKVFLSKGWYLDEMIAVKEAFPELQVFGMHWEEIFNAISLKS
ncbi:hypothetical protein [Vibrio sp. 10N.247.310.17]|uniref:hypothetical protein n=1 Tax=Vibrio sp. 10N.247.310.17 TaxID=3229979 RepID=UPI00354E8A3D